MGLLLDYHGWGSEFFLDDTPNVRNIKHAQFGGAIIDEVMVREKTNQGTTNVKDAWQNDTRILAKFVGSLEAGNVNQNGVKIVKFAIKRRIVGEYEDKQIGEVNFTGNQDLEFSDYTQPNTKLIYTIIPVGENNLEGTPVETEAESNFVGWWIVDKDTLEVLPFDKALGSVGNVDTTLTQNRTVIETFANLPSVYYGNQAYHSFTLDATFLPEEWERSGEVYQRILNNFIRSHKPFLVKASTGEVYVVDLSNIRKSTPQNAYRGYDYMQISVDALEIMDYDDYIQDNGGVSYATF